MGDRRRRARTTDREDRTAQTGAVLGRRATAAVVVAGALVAAACGSIGTVTGGGSSGTVNVAVDASKSGAPINESLLGVDGPGPSGATAAIAALGLHFDRTDVGFEGSYDCSSGTWNSSGLDGRVAQIRAEGSVPLLIVDYTPSCLQTAEVSPLSETYSPPDQGSHQTTWKSLVQEMAYHEITAEGVRYFEVWNEPDGLFWSGGLSGYEQLYSDTATAIQAAAARAGSTVEIGGPALANLTGLMDTLFLDPFLSYVSSHDLPLDFLSWHVYADYPMFGPIGPIPMPPSWLPITWYNPALSAGMFTSQAGSAESSLSKYPSLHPELIVDEWNADAGYDPRHSGPYDAAFAAAVLARAQGSQIGAMAFFNVSDSSNDARANWGLLDSNFSPKPVYSTFDFWHRMAGSQIPASVAGDGDGYVGAVASKSSGGTVSVLVYNFKGYDLPGNYGTGDPTPYDHSVTLTVSGLGSGSYSATRRAIDGSHSGTQVSTGTVSASHDTLTFTVPGEGVELVTLAPAG